MILWRLSGRDHARRFDGGYGLAHHGRWNTRGRPLTYCATSAALCLLEKLVHVEDPGLIPDNLFMVRYDAPDDLGMELLEPRDLPANWRRSEAVTQALGDAWADAGAAPLLSVPSIVLPLADSGERNVLINHRHPGAGRITILDATPFELDARLLRS